jgi:hypothetical protein
VLIRIASCILAVRDGESRTRKKESKPSEAIAYGAWQEEDLKSKNVFPMIAAYFLIGLAPLISLQ